MKKSIIEKKYDVVVVGGGMSGVCAAIASARGGARTALVHNRPVLGGNASSEIRMHICGACGHGSRPDGRETGILEEILLENRNRNPYHSFSIFDTVLWEKVYFQQGLDLYLNTHMTNIDAQNDLIKSVTAEQITTEKCFRIEARIFIDTTGDATLAFLSGAECMKGREGKNAFGEKNAPNESEPYTMGSTLMFKAVDTGHPAPFEKPFWANTYTEEDLIYRGHDEIETGYWWIELGGGELDTVADSEQIRDELLKAVYGVWDHIKNSGKHGAENYVLDWVGFLPGKRESRRVAGGYILKEQDLFEGKIFDDAVAYGGWPMDMHVVEGLKNKLEPTEFIHLDDIYSIPYRSLYSKNIRNLMVGGRAISASHMAFGSVRIMATCSVVGQAAGTAAAMAILKGIFPADMLNHIRQLQQQLIRDDCYIPGFNSDNETDIARKAVVTCSSSLKGYECQNVVNGHIRNVKDKTNCWVSGEMVHKVEWICLEFNMNISPCVIDIKFDSNLSREFMISMSRYALDKQVPGIPPELVKDYRIELYDDKNLVWEENITENYMRHRVHYIDKNIICDKAQISVLSTNGDRHARIFEVSIY